jgi:hypothetical protein
VEVDFQVTKKGGAFGGWQRSRMVERSAIKGMAKEVWICRACGEWNGARWDKVKGKSLPPPECSVCGRMDFEHFQSEGEAKYWMRLVRRQEDGIIAELERQYRIPLLTVHHATGKPVWWADMVADFRWLDVKTGQRIVAEYKPRDLMSYDAQLKIRCAEAMGIPIEIVSL